MVFYFTPRGCTPGKDDWLLYMVRRCHAAMCWARHRWSSLPPPPPAPAAVLCTHSSFFFSHPWPQGLDKYENEDLIKYSLPHVSRYAGCMRWWCSTHFQPARLLSLLPCSALLGRRNCIDGRHAALSIPTCHRIFGSMWTACPLPTSTCACRRVRLLQLCCRCFWCFFSIARGVGTWLHS